LPIPSDAIYHIKLGCVMLTLARSLELTDEEEISALTERLSSDGYRLQSLVELVATSDSFFRK